MKKELCLLAAGVQSSALSAAVSDAQTFGSLSRKLKLELYTPAAAVNRRQLNFLAFVIVRGLFITLHFFGFY